MYAVFQNGGKQYRVSERQVVRLEKLNIAIGEPIKFTKVLMVMDNEKIKIGAPFIKEGIIEGEVINHGRNRKIRIIKFRRRKHYRKQQGHRQWFTDVKITGINIPESEG